MMTRNMEKRVEILFPIFEGKLKKKLKSFLALQLSDNLKGREQDSNGVYHYVKKTENEPEIGSQATLIADTNYFIEDVKE